MNKTNTTIEREFFDAINNGDIDSIRKHVSQQPALLDSFDYNCFGATPLTSVTFRDDREVVETLIELGADPNRRSDWNMGPWSPVHSAIHSNQMELVEYLLAHGAELDVHAAAALGRLDDINRLLDQSPERISEQGGDGCTPLHFAGTQEAAQLLLDRGADIEARCVDHFSTPIQYLADARPNIARYLVAKGAKPDIFSAVLSGDLETVKKLVEHDDGVLDLRINQETFPPGPDPGVHNIMTFTIGHQSTPLHAAAKGDQVEMIELLIQMGADPNVRGGYDDATPLHQAAWQDHLATAQALIKHGADIDMHSGEIHNNSPAGWAIVAGSADVFCLLMDVGAEILDFFADDAQAAVDGEFRQYKVVPQVNYERIKQRLQSR